MDEMVGLTGTIMSQVQPSCHHHGQHAVLQCHSVSSGVSLETRSIFVNKLCWRSPLLCTGQTHLQFLSALFASCAKLTLLSLTQHHLSCPLTTNSPAVTPGKSTSHSVTGIPIPCHALLGLSDFHQLQRFIKLGIADSSSFDNRRGFFSPLLNVPFPFGVQS